MTKKRYTLTARERHVEEWFEWPMIFVTLLLLFTLLVPLFFTLPQVWVRYFAVLNLVIWFSFYIELFIKLYVAHNKWESIKRNWFLVIIAIAPLFLSFRLMRVSRLVSAVRLLGFQPYVRKLKRSVREFIYNIEYILITIMLFVMLSALIMWQIEVRFDGSVTTLPDALWWAVITITTIGYGDIVPTSVEGRIFGSMVALLGTMLFMIFIARVTTMFVHDKDTESIKRLIRESQRK